MMEVNAVVVAFTVSSPLKTWAWHSNYR